MPEPASAAELDAYRKHGFFVRERVLPESDCEALRDAVEGVHARVASAAAAPDASPVERVDDKRYQRLCGSTIKWEWREGATQIRSMEPFVHLDPVLETLVDDPRIWSPLAGLIGSERLSLFTDKLNFKRPGGAPFPWHQDGPYWAFGCDHLDRLASVQIYLDDATRENGCLWMIPGTHTAGALPVFRDRGVLDRLYTDLGQVDDAPEPVAIEAPAGSLICFHGDVVHGSQSNRSDRSRRAIVLTYQPEGLSRWSRDDVRPIGQGSAR